jgi:hypothetical protein
MLLQRQTLGSKSPRLPAPKSNYEFSSWPQYSASTCSDVTVVNHFVYITYTAGTKRVEEQRRIRSYFFSLFFVSLSTVIRRI